MEKDSGARPVEVRDPELDVTDLIDFFKIATSVQGRHRMS